jgi:hypothetical protein
MLADILVGFAVVLILAAALAVSLKRRQAVVDHLADSRAATRVAEQTLTALQSGQAAPMGDAETKIEIRPAGAAAADVAGLRWVTVEITRNGRKASLTGLAKANAVPATQPATRPAEAGGAR